ncbi:MAG: type II toxin-antitoxin system CcdA family antitoxin [Gammaproteobacteria bacterium]|nr:type II toxin-antitoxin system CcdA family antitoxin [Gammaproteobacteria bacterium]
MEKTIRKNATPHFIRAHMTRINMADPESIYNPQVKKKSVNLSINNDLIEKARALKINLSQTLESAFSDGLRKF